METKIETYSLKESGALIVKNIATAILAVGLFSFAILIIVGIYEIWDFEEKIGSLLIQYGVIDLFITIISYGILFGISKITEHLFVLRTMKAFEYKKQEIEFKPEVIENN